MDSSDRNPRKFKSFLRDGYPSLGAASSTNHLFKTDAERVHDLQSSLKRSRNYRDEQRREAREVYESIRQSVHAERYGSGKAERHGSGTFSADRLDWRDRSTGDGGIATSDGLETARYDRQSS